MGGTIIQCVDKNMLLELAMHRGWIKSEQYELTRAQRKYAVVIPLRYGAKKYVVTRSGIMPLSWFRLHTPGEYACNDGKRLYSWLREHLIGERLWYVPHLQSYLLYVWFEKEHAWVLHTSKVIDSEMTKDGYLNVPHVITSVTDAFRIATYLDANFEKRERSSLSYRIR